jgi:hypothetical protein
MAVMNLSRIWPPLAAAAVLVLSQRAFGWPGVALAAGGLVMWLLLHWNRTMVALQRAAKRPVGFVDSAVMLHSRLAPGLSLLHVIALTRSLGRLLSQNGTQPESYVWRDASDATVTCEFMDGKLMRWELARPPEGASTAAS